MTRTIAVATQATWQQLDLLAREHSQPFQELADEAFADLLAKYDRSVDLKTQLRKSATQERPQVIDRSNAPLDLTGRRKPATKKRG